MKRAYSKLFGIHTAVGVAIAPPDSLYNCRICAGVLIVGTVGAGTRYIGTAVVIKRTRAAAACRCRDKVHTAPRSGSCRAEKTFPPIFRASGLDLPSLHIGIRKLGSSLLIQTIRRCKRYRKNTYFRAKACILRNFEGRRSRTIE